MVVKSRAEYAEQHDQILAMVVIENLTKDCGEHRKVCEFVKMNIIAIRKILKKFDKKLDNFSLPMTDQYLRSRMFPATKN